VVVFVGLARHDRFLDHRGFLAEGLKSLILGCLRILHPHDQLYFLFLKLFNVFLRSHHIQSLAICTSFMHLRRFEILLIQIVLFVSDLVDLCVYRIRNHPLFLLLFIAFLSFMVIHLFVQLAALIHSLVSSALNLHLPHGFNSVDIHIPRCRIEQFLILYFSLFLLLNLMLEHNVRHLALDNLVSLR